MILAVRRGNDPGQEIRLERGLLSMGRASDCDLVLQEVQASRHHAELRRHGDQWLIVDLGSTNGTFLRGTRLKPDHAYTLKQEEAVTIGSTTFCLRPERQDELGGRSGVGVPPMPQAQDAGASIAPGLSPGQVWLLWLSRLLAVAGCALLVVGSVSDWLQVEIRLPLVNQQLERTFSGMDVAQSWLYIGVAGAALLLLAMDVASHRWGLASGVGQALLGSVAAFASALSFYRYYQIGTEQIWGISLLDVLQQVGREFVQLSVRAGIYLLAAGLAALILGGLMRLVVASLQPAPGRMPALH